jgi:hypothetical protein
LTPIKKQNEVQTRINKVINYCGTKFKSIPAQTQLNSVYYLKRVRGKAILIQARTGLEGARRLRLPYFKTIGT